MNVLVVEDDDDFRFLVGGMFRDIGCSVREAGDGAEALDLLSNGRWRPDVIVLDMAMPVMDGFAFLAEKQKAAELSDIPVVIVSSTARAPVTGARCVLPKPVDANDLVRAVRQSAT